MVLWRGEKGFPHLSQGLVSTHYAGSYLGKTLGGAFDHLLAIAGGKPGAEWTGEVTERPPE